jgi:phage terminase large subunit GpA-like protein
VTNFVRPRVGRRVYAIFGRAGANRPIWPPKGNQNKAKNITYFILGVDQGKDTHYKRLEIKEPGPGYCHFPLKEQYDKKHFEGLTAEKAVLVTDKKGFVKKEWHKVHQRNEPLDVRVYNIAARLSLGINMERRLMFLHQAAANVLNHAPTSAKTPQQQTPPPPAAASAGRRRVRSQGVER